MPFRAKADPETQKKSTPQSKTLLRIFRFTGVRIVTLFITVVIAIYLTILIANMGGYVDTMMRSEVEDRVTQQVASNPVYKKMPVETRKKLAQEEIQLEIKRLGLDQPLAVRTSRYLVNAITLNLGRAQNMVSDTGSRSVKNILLERLPATILLMGTSELLLFFASLFLALGISRKYGSFWDKFVIAMTPTSSAPGWFYGIFLILIFSAVLKILPFGGLVAAPPPKNIFLSALS
jgi:peptide/nickel transport system permease protein